MERESFENEEIAEKMNAGFVCIKLDREERPDVDEVYMAATVTMTGHGGWPMSVFLDPHTLRPFWCGTYFPAKPLEGLGPRPTFPQVLDAMSGVWRTQREAAADQAEAIAKAVSEQLTHAGDAAELSRQPVMDATAMLLRAYDRKHGGFGNAPKFPQVCFLEFLLEARAVAGDDSTSDSIDLALRGTLDAMAIGGIRDHVGGGFHRYSVDSSWTVPHFEKMLYDNAQHASIYAKAGRHYGDEFYTFVARQTADYVLRELTSPDGAFHSAQDAEVDGREGLNYLWTPAQIDAVLGSDPESAALAMRLYGLDDGPNFRDPHHPSEPATNVLRLSDRPERLAGQLDMPLPALQSRLDRINSALLAARSVREQPTLDDKCITAWNGMMIRALVDVYRATEDHTYLDAAERCATSLLARSRSDDGRLLRSVRGGIKGPPAVLEDYAFLLSGLISLHEVNGGRHDDMASLIETARRDFLDSGGFSDSPVGRADLFVRPRSTHDGAVPCAASVMVHNFIDLAAATGQKTFLRDALESLRSLGKAVADSPVGSINSTRALLRMLQIDDVEVDSLLSSSRSASGSMTAPSGTSGNTVHDDPVEIYAAVDRITVSEDKPAELTLLLRIADGYHIIASDPGDSDASRTLIPLRIGVANGSGVAVYADYPPGEPYGTDPTSTIMTLKGSVELRVAVERSGAWSGRPILTATYQACTDTACLAARTVELDVAIDRA